MQIRLGQIMILFTALFSVNPFASAQSDSSSSALMRCEYLESKMAVPVRIILYAPSRQTADEAAAAVYRRFDELNAALSDWSPESELVRACRTAGETLEPVDIGDDLYRVLEAARSYGELSGGAFDVSVSPVVKLWRRARSFGERPPEEYLQKAKNLIGPDHWKLIPPIDGNPARLCVTEKNVRLDLGGIAKGFALDEGFKILRERGLTVALIDCGGDLVFGDAPPETDGWNVAVASLDHRKPLQTRQMTNRATATSGDEFQFVEIQGVRYSHIIDPRSGEPLTQRSVVTIIAESATAADALASAVTVLGPKEGRTLVDQLPNVEAILPADEAEE